ncbi:MAG: sigma 54-interacting transcriptional regulator [Bacteroidia bacterium]
MRRKPYIPPKKGRVLISWIAWYKDFILNREPGQASESPNHDGPTFDLHRRYINQTPETAYEKHILLSSAEDGDLKSLDFYTELERRFRDHEIEREFLGIKDIFDFQELKAKTGQILEQYADCDIDILFSNGTTPMRMVWVLHHLEQKYRTRLIQGKDSRATEGVPAFHEIKLNPEAFLWRLEARAEEIFRTKTEGSQPTITAILQALYKKAEKIALSHDPKVSALILGESGTGKEQLARHIHENSSRRGHAFEIVNCAAVPEYLTESLLFGHKKGSFTDSQEDHRGHFDLANKGTVFLDEIGDAHPRLQQVLLRALQEHVIRPIGKPEKKVDVKIIAATNKNLRRLCQEGLFRWDLYYRLATVTLKMPVFADFPVSEKREIIDSLLEKKAFTARREKLRLSPQVEKWMYSYTFPGNIRELENLITHFYVMAEGKEVKMEDLPEDILESAETHTQKLADVERAHILKTLAQYNQQYQTTAQALGISYNTLITRLRSYGEYHPHGTNPQAQG